MAAARVGELQRLGVDDRLVLQRALRIRIELGVGHLVAEVPGDHRRGPQGGQPVVRADRRSSGWWCGPRPRASPRRSGRRDPGRSPPWSAGWRRSPNGPVPPVSCCPGRAARILAGRPRSSRPEWERWSRCRRRAASSAGGAARGQQDRREGACHGQRPPGSRVATARREGDWSAMAASSHRCADTRMPLRATWWVHPQPVRVLRGAGLRVARVFGYRFEPKPARRLAWSSFPSRGRRPCPCESLTLPSSAVSRCGPTALPSPPTPGALDAVPRLSPSPFRLAER